MISFASATLLFLSCGNKEEPPILEIRDLLDSSHIADSIEKAKQSAEKSGKTDQIRYLRGWIHYLRKEDDLARVEFSGCLKENPSAYDCSRGLGLIESQGKTYPEAEKNFREALASATEAKDLEAISILRSDLGNLYLRQNRKKEAAFEYRKSLEAKQDGSAYYGLAVATLMEGDRTSAKFFLEQGLKTHFRDSIFKAETYFLLGKIQFESEKNAKAAAESAKKAFELFPAKEEYRKAWEKYAKSASSPQ
ncbi:hypothetical protein CH373_10565 [Leptospira perolatii]|uniref:Tetratricopeptide repeat protein n=1 Tax=Leptospira perolatii TaxID=2023191 RepID=A0A2M9ZMC2_9LEPT|nr:hypothetical protein CH360_09670 [Leptospira perolatii]PJZ73154.1 hypothetical protein CH373_10565 [Leptospira perolatii]